MSGVLLLTTLRGAVGTRRRPPRGLLGGGPISGAPGAAALSAALRQTRTVSGTGPALPSQPGEIGLVPEYVLLSAKPTTEDAAVLAGTTAIPFAG